MIFCMNRYVRAAGRPGCAHETALTRYRLGSLRRPVTPGRDLAATQREGRVRADEFPDKVSARDGRARPNTGRSAPASKRVLGWAFLLAIAGLTPLAVQASDPAPLFQRLHKTPFKLVYESYVDSNWDLFVVNADGTGAVNLTRTPGENELYPQVSPDGKRIAFVSDKGQGRETVRSVYYMDADGKNRKKVADHARQPFWSPDGKILAYLPQEYPKFNVVDYYTKGVAYYNLATGQTRMHPNSENLHHLYNPNFSRNGKWIAATVHAGMGFSHAILLIEAEGDKIINLGIPGCRPCLSPDGKQIAWGPGDHELAVAPIDLNSENPKVGERRVRIKDEKLKIYHIDWSPDSRFLSFSRGPDGEGDLTQPNTHRAACEIVGVHAAGWNLFAVSAEKDGVLDLNSVSPDQYVPLTTNGMSNKESAWFKPGRKRRE
jgi:dipeptidyl aminopeptidase/acylaminoacyl peptidase